MRKLHIQSEFDGSLAKGIILDSRVSVDSAVSCLFQDSGGGEREGLEWNLTYESLSWPSLQSALVGMEQRLSACQGAEINC